MNSSRLGLIAAVFLTAKMFVWPALAVEVHTLEIGAAAPDFSLPGVDGKTYSLKDFAKAKLLCVIWTCNHCPTAQAYEQRIIQLQKDYREKGVAIVAISPNSPQAVRLNELRFSDISDSFAEMKIRAKERGFEFPYLYDGDTQTTAHAYGVQATPHIFIFDEKRTLRYVGSIDDQQVKPVTQHYATDAIEALLAGKPVAVEKTRVFGCSTKWIEKGDSAKQAVAKWDAEPVDIKPIDAKAIKSLAANDSKKLLLVNLWATWCGPCTAELGDLVTLHRTYRTRDFELVMISLDDLAQQDRALKMLRDNHASTTNFIYGAEGKDALAAALDKEWPGPIPYTILIAPGGKIIYRHGGAIEPAEVKRTIVNYLGRTYAK